MSAPKWVRAFITVPVALQAAAAEQAALLDFDVGGAATFDVPLGPEGATEPTDYGASMLLRPKTLDAVIGQLLPAFPGARVYAETGGWSVRSALADAGLMVLTQRAG